MNSKCLEELDLEDNHIGELGGKQLMEGLEYRKEGRSHVYLKSIDILK